MKILRYIWFGILIVVTICTIVIIGKEAYSVFSEYQNLTDFLLQISFGSMIIGCLAVLGFLFYKLISSNGWDEILK